MNWLENSINTYYQWLRDKTVLSKDTPLGWYTITTPFLGLFNDYIEIYVKKEGDNIILSDDGRTLNNLELTGTFINRSSKRKDLLEMILLNHGITNNEGELQTIATTQNFSQKKHNLICAISEISDMEIINQNNIASVFKEDVATYLNEQNIVHTPQFIAKGATGLDFTFDFQIAGLRNEIVIKSFNSLNKINVPNFLFGWNDIKDPRERITGKRLRALAIINDLEKDPKDEYIDALISKGTDCFKWSQRNAVESLNLLKAS